MMNLFEEIYDGDLNFEIVNEVIGAEEITMDLLAEHEGEKIGFQVVVPIQTRRMMFKSMVMPNVSAPIVFRSLGECSDNFVSLLDKVWSPDFEVDGKFEDCDVEIEFSVLNKEIFDVTKDKTYTRLYAQIDMETGDEYDNINMELGFNFNLERKRASLVETKRVMRNDFLALIMK